MELTLIRTGGLLPVTKKATRQTSLNEAELTELLESIKTDSAPGKKADATTYQLAYNNTLVTVDLENVPAKYRALIDDLKDNLKIERPA